MAQHGVPAKRYTKLELARAHIHAAIALGDDPKHSPSVLHLAAAADEMLEDLLKRDGKETATQRMFKVIQQMAPGVDRVTFYNALMHMKNAVKHAKRRGENEVTVLGNEGIFALMRAISNYKALAGRLTPDMTRSLKSHSKELIVLALFPRAYGQYLAGKRYPNG